MINIWAQIQIFHVLIPKNEDFKNQQNKYILIAKKDQNKIFIVFLSCSKKQVEQVEQWLLELSASLLAGGVVIFMSNPT